ncbi:MAG: putative tyrosine-family recombinase/integrase [Candidatus Saccharibacteria bacterium]|nr:putative tyrosine-family recombinase/integrase [Candidatus Saccharibacteria bacterium]
MRRRRGEGTIYKRKDGRFEVAAFIRSPIGIERVRRYTKTRVQAEEMLVELRNKNKQGILTNTKEKKFSDYMDYWLSVTEQSVRKSTYTSYETTIRLYLKPGLGDKYLTRLSVTDLQSYLDNQLRLGLSVRNIQKMRIVLSSILHRAMQEELVNRNVARLTNIPMYLPNEAKPWNMNQLGIFLESASSHHLYPIFLLMSLYGLRTGEALALSWSDIDIEKRVIYIRHQVQYDKNTYYFTEPKTRAGRRELPLVDIVASALSTVNRTSTGPLPDLIFKTSGNLPIDNNNLRRAFKSISKKVGLPIITLHYLRHTAATNLKDIGISAKDTQSILGHAHITTTLQIYQHTDIIGKAIALEKYEQELVDMSAYCRQILPSNEKVIA